MNKLFIVGNLTKDPELRTTQDGKSVCNFYVAVNRRQKDKDGNNIADFFRVSAWSVLADICAKYLAKGRKVAVTGEVRLHTYESNGKSGASMEVIANDVEFLTHRGETTDKQTGMTKVEVDDNPFDSQEELPY